MLRDCNSNYWWGVYLVTNAKELMKVERTLTLPENWSCSIWICVSSNVETSLSSTCYAPGLWILNIPRYFYFSVPMQLEFCQMCSLKSHISTIAIYKSAIQSQQLRSVVRSLPCDPHKSSSSVVSIYARIKNLLVKQGYTLCENHQQNDFKMVYPSKQKLFLYFNKLVSATSGGQDVLEDTCNLFYTWLWLLCIVLWA